MKIKKYEGHAKKIRENKTNNFAIFLVAAAFFILITSDSSIATPTILSDYGSNVRSKATGNLLDDGDLTVMIYTQESGGAAIYTESFEDAINDGAWRVTLGLSGDLDLDYMTRYYKSYTINDEAVTFTDYLGQEQERIAFDSPYGYTSSQYLPECSDGELARYNSSSGNWTCSIDISEEELPSSCDQDDILEYDGAGWDCGEDNITNLPVCAEDKVLKVNSGLWDCGDDSDTQLNESQISEMVGNWASDMANYYTKDEVDNEFDEFVPSVSYNDLADLPANIDTDATDDFSGDYGDLSGAPNTSNWDINASDDFTGNWNDLSSVPADIADGDDVLSNDTVFAIINNSDEYYTQSEVNSQLLSKQDSLTGAEAIFNGWDKDAGNDFDGTWASLSGVPADIADGDNDTILINSTVIDIINNSGFASESYVDSRIFSGSWNDLSDIPNDLQDGDNDTVLLPSDIAAMVGNWSEDKNDYATEVYVNDALNSINYSDINNTPSHDGWDTNASDDFTGNWSNLTGIPANLDIDSTDDFDGTWGSLSGIPADISDGDNDTTYVFNDGFIVDGDEINLSLNTSFLSIKNGLLTLGNSGTCGVDGMEMSYNCSSQEWSWTDKPRYLLKTGDTATGSYTFDSGTFQIDADTNRIGIGTKTPDYLAQIVTNGNERLTFAVNLQNPNSTIGNTSVGILFTVDSNSSYGKGALVYQRNQSDGRGDFHFLQEYHAAAAEPSIDQAVMTLKNNGNVGIGNKEPAVKLDVNGAIRMAPGAPPGACSADLEGAIYYNSTTHLFLGCNGTTWEKLN